MTYWKWITLTFIVHILFGIYAYVTKIKNNESVKSWIQDETAWEFWVVMFIIMGILNTIPHVATLSATGIGIVWIIMIAYRLIENVFMKIDSIGIKKDGKVVDEE